jgi:CBS domain-containing protein
LKGKTSQETLVRDIMSTKVICTRPDQSVQECMAVMTARAVRHLPVLEHGQLVGIVSIGDMVNSVIGDQKFIIEQLEHYIHGDR